jgi:hypothetical protein
MKNASEKNDSQRSHRYVVVLFSAKISSFSQFGNWELGIGKKYNIDAKRK